MKTAKRLLALALASVMALALLTGCSDSSSKAKQVEECFRSLMKTRQNKDYQKDETLDRKLEAIAQQFQPDWLAGGGDRLTEDARNIIINELGDYLETGRVWLWYGEVKPCQSALAQAESMKQCNMVGFGRYDPSSGTALNAIAFTMTDKKSDGHRYYLALETNATVKTPQT